MNINVKKIRRMALLLGLVMMLAVVCASCVNLDNVDEVNPKSALGDDSDVNIDVSDESIVVPEGATNPPEISKVVSITPDTIAISGTCAENAAITVTGGKEDAHTVANGEYFIIKVDLQSKNDLLKITAQAEGEDPSPELQLRPVYDATAQDRLDGNSVTVGKDSRLYFAGMEADATGENLYTESQLSAIGTVVGQLGYDYYYQRANGQPVELIYVLVPNVTTVYPGIMNVTPAEKTIYDQVLGVLDNSLATVVDMREIFRAELENNKEDAEKYGLYRVTDSALTDYGAYLTYKATMDVVAKRFPEAAPYGTDMFDWSEVNANGGNLVDYRELDDEVITEKMWVSKPKFSLDYGVDDKGSTNIKSLQKYVDSVNGDYNFFTDIKSDDKINGIAEGWEIETGRTNLPSAVIYRDYASYSFSNILAERFQNSVLVEGGDFKVDMNKTKVHKSEGRNVADYVIVIVSEENFDTAFNSMLQG